MTYEANNDNCKSYSNYCNKYIRKHQLMSSIVSKNKHLINTFCSYIVLKNKIVEFYCIAVPEVVDQT